MKSTFNINLICIYYRNYMDEMDQSLDFLLIFFYCRPLNIKNILN